MNILNIKDLNSDNLLNIIQILIKDYEQKLDNQCKFYDEKIADYQNIVDDKNTQIDYLEQEINEVIDHYHDEIDKNIYLEKQLQNNHLT